MGEEELLFFALVQGVNWFRLSLRQAALWSMNGTGTIDNKMLQSDLFVVQTAK